MIQKQEILEILQIDLVLYSVHCGIIQHHPIIETQQTLLVAGEFKLKNTEFLFNKLKFCY